jgi:voltage-dependent potassium channel beta subunit
MDMQYRRLGKSGLQVSSFSFGAWLTFGKQVDDSVAEECLQTAYDAGVNFFDNAEAYAQGQAEKVMGQILAKQNWPRDSFLVSSKVFFGAERRGPNQIGLSRKHVIEACHAAMQRLQVDYLDLYFCHRPDPDTRILETVRAMNTLIEQGKVLYWGTSEWTARDIQEAHMMAERYGLIPPTMEQPQYNLFHRQKVEKDFKPLYASEHGLGTTVWSPLASGILTGKYLDGIPDDSRLAMDGLDWLKDHWLSEDKFVEMLNELNGVADDLGTSLHRMALAWCLKNPHVSTVILGASKVSQLKDNLQALEVVPQMTDEVMEKLDRIVSPEE